MFKFKTTQFRIGKNVDLKKTEDISKKIQQITSCNDYSICSKKISSVKILTVRGNNKIKLFKMLNDAIENEKSG